MARRSRRDYEARVSLALYGYPSCDYTSKVLRAVEALNAPVEFRDTMVDPAHRKELVREVGAGTVPVLRIEEEGEVRWLQESSAIVGYLYERFGDGKAPPGFDRLAMQRAATVVMWLLLALGMFLVEHQPVLWASACGIGALRSFEAAWHERRGGKPLMQAGIGMVFLFAVATIVLREVGYADVPWWYAAYGLIALLALASFVIARRARKKDGE